MLRNLTIKARLGFNLLLLCSLLLAAGGLGVYGTVVNHRVTERVAADESEVVVIGRVNVKVFDSRLHIAQAQLNSEADSLVQEGRVIQENNAETRRDLAELRRLAGGSPHGAVVERFVDTVGAFVDNYLQPAEAALLAGDARRLAEIVKSSGSRYYSPIKQSRGALMQAIEESTARHQAEAGATYALTLRLMGLLLGCGLLLAVGVGILIARSISRDTGALLAGMLRIQQDHDLSVRLPVAGADELAQVAAALNGLLDTLHRFAGSVRAQSEGNIAATTALLGKAEAVLASARQQNREAGLASQQLTEIVASIHAIARHVTATRELTSEGSALGRQGSAVVTETAQEMARLADRVQEAADDIRQLDKQSSEIDAVVSAINDIAEQTNLLALNAAIEAARAGESGRGFAVVADEVRKLAERTREMTGEIQATIGNIRRETATATACMEAGRQLAENGVQTAQEAARHIVRIQESLDAINQGVGGIADTLATQELAADGVASQLVSIVRRGEENTSSAEGSRDLASASAEGSRSLAQAAALFRV